jgi:hypothetical protein
MVAKGFESATIAMLAPFTSELSAKTGQAIH